MHAAHHPCNLADYPRHPLPTNFNGRGSMRPPSLPERTRTCHGFGLMEPAVPLRADAFTGLRETSESTYSAQKNAAEEATLGNETAFDNMAASQTIGTAPARPTQARAERHRAVVARREKDDSPAGAPRTRAAALWPRFTYAVLRYSGLAQAICKKPGDAAHVLQAELRMRPKRAWRRQEPLRRFR